MFAGPIYPAKIHGSLSPSLLGSSTAPFPVPFYCPLYCFPSIGTNLADSYTLQIKWLSTLIVDLARQNKRVGNRKRMAISKVG